MVLRLTNEEIEELLKMKDCIAVLEEAYKDLGVGRGVNRPRSHTLSPTSKENLFYRFKSMEGTLPKLGVHALRLSSDVITNAKTDGNLRREKLPTAEGSRWLGLILLFNMETGDLMAVMPDGFIQRMRVGGTSGLGVKYLARPDASVVGLLGSGWQAGAQLEAICAVRNVRSVKVYSPNREHRQRFTDVMGEKLGVEVRPVDHALDAVKESDIVACATNSLEPVLQGSWLQKGTHLGAILTLEVDKDSFTRSDVVIVHTKLKHTDHFMPAFSWDRAHRSGGNVLWGERPELAELIVGKIAGRANPEEITFFFNNGGLGIQFAAVGHLVYTLAKERGFGSEIPADWFLQTVHP